MTTLKYPLTVQNGTLVLTTGYSEKIPEVITHILMTSKEERVLNPDFGVDEGIFSLVSNIPQYLRSLESSLTAGLQEYPGVSIRLVGYIEADSGEIPVTCYWSLEDLTGEVTVTL
jgi:hypothetical protein